jgi:hypothetical protein
VCPRRISSAERRRPINPVAPAMKTRDITHDTEPAPKWMSGGTS